MLIQFYESPFPPQNNKIKKSNCDSQIRLFDFFSSELQDINRELQDINVKLREGKSESRDMIWVYISEFCFYVSATVIVTS